ncbi:MAG: LptF/LptG family permease [Planctomycetota bacterium]|jgi:lipopolysaccharide export system permease protein
MKKIDKYIIKNFLIGYVISFCVLIGLRIIIDLFVNLDEFTENVGLGTWVVIRNIFMFYGLNSTLYFRDFAGTITMVAAAFSLGRMVRSNELVAVMASGVSLKRVMAPILVMSIILTGIFVIDQEFIIPPLSSKLVRSHDDLPGQETYDVRFIDDADSSLICSQKFDVKTATLYKPIIIKRKMVKKDDLIKWNFHRLVLADKAVYNADSGGWDMINGRFVEKDSEKGFQKINFYASDIRAEDIPVRCKSRNKTLLSWKQLSTLGRLGGVKDAAQIYSQMHFHITEPIINIVMILVCLPILVCRDPKAMTTAIGTSFLLTGLCLIAMFVCRMFSTEVVFWIWGPELWAWLPIFIFGPIAFLELDSMKT